MQLTNNSEITATCRTDAGDQSVEMTSIAAIREAGTISCSAGERPFVSVKISDQWGTHGCP